MWKISEEFKSLNVWKAMGQFQVTPFIMIGIVIYIKYKNLSLLVNVNTLIIFYFKGSLVALY